ncbi:hypothetical protein B0H17DRAFT_1150383 [Mycena rosella]|uniref:Uncharacterized protein n=1 Tax=Mycena rosella TaxID=1033263 RepID=A0AAD7FNY4_MYCRO|nr:hypothetical protein B0H17DRAFT_1150383 [Mycena rosella]
MAVLQGHAMASNGRRLKNRQGKCQFALSPANLRPRIFAPDGHDIQLSTRVIRSFQFFRLRPLDVPAVVRHASCRKRRGKRKIRYNETRRSQGTQGPIPGYQTHGPSCNGFVALVVTEQSDGQQLGTPNIPTLAQSLLSVDRNAMENVELEHRKHPNIVEGTTRRMEVQMGDIENEYSSPRDNIDRESNDACADENSWEAENVVIRKRNKPPRALKSGKFTCSNLTFGSLNVAGRDANILIHNRNHKFKFLKETIDTNNLGLLGMREGHFDLESATQFNNVFGRWFKLFYSAHPESHAPQPE